MKRQGAAIASEFLMLGGMIGILLVMVLPLPSVLLDVFLTFSIAFSLAILMVAMYTRKPLEFSVFPPLLLLVTLGRLALNVASTRLILLEGFAGDVIATFGRFVVGGNYVVGIVIFLILVLIQFVVITNGAGRVAEVAARFTLDALPGKQMSIDADLSAGLISQEDAQKRRREVEREADFYGAMDGAAKFVKGDAIASLVITSINILGGFCVGVFQKGMPLIDAVQRYTLLTIGDGLVGQISALLVSTATGLIVTRAASESHLGADLTREVLVQPTTLNRIGWLLGGFALIPGMPKAPFLLLGTAAVLTARRLQATTVEEQAPAPDPVGEDGPEDVRQLLDLEPVELAIGYALVPLVDGAAGGELLERVVGVRRSLATDLGIVVPPIRIRDDLELRPGQYQFRLYGQSIADGEVYPNRLLAMASQQETTVKGIAVREPAFGLPALWIPEQTKEQAEMEGLMVVDPASVVATHLSEILKKHACELIGREDVQALLDRLKALYPKLVSEVIPSMLSVTELRKVLRNLLSESISIRDLRLILETLADHIDNDRDPAWLTEKVRESLSRALLSDYLGPDKHLPVAALSPALEEVIGRVLPGGPGLDPDTLRRIITLLSEGAGQVAARGHHPTIITSQRVRPLVRRMVERAIPGLTVFSYEELPKDISLDTVAVVEARELRGLAGVA
ncbi:MAG: flagellar biosynthesis protein FlhA [Vulcanimicrobiota bacterium]